jgi:hypothetical protein
VSLYELAINASLSDIVSRNVGGVHNILLLVSSYAATTGAVDVEIVHEKNGIV